VNRFAGLQRRAAAVLIVLALAGMLGGCGAFSRTVRVEPVPIPIASPDPGPAPATDLSIARTQQTPATVVAADAGEPAASSVVTPGPDADLPIPRSEPITAAAAGQPDVAPAVTLPEAAEASAAPAQVVAQAGEDRGEPADIEPYDPWEPFNEKMFEFNRRLDRYVLKPVAKAYNAVVPDIFQIMIANGFDNLGSPQRFVNSLLQRKFGGAVRELGRFLVNSTIGVGGLFDPARDYLKWQKSREDFGQTLGFYGSGPGPYLVLPFMEPLTVRDGIGKAIDGLMDPLSYLIPFIPERLLMKIGETVNDRSLNLELFQGFEETVIDMYSAVRHGYLQRRERLIRE
jgi:phospholipid-binding lipoprotein MlaA